jgi:hypothetical protein
MPHYEYTWLCYAMPNLVFRISLFNFEFSYRPTCNNSTFLHRVLFNIQSRMTVYDDLCLFSTSNNPQSVQDK